MSTETAPALEKNESKFAGSIPESGKQGLAPVKSDYGAGEVWKDEPAQQTETVKKDESKPAEETKPAVTPEATGLASKWAAKVKVKAPAADIPQKPTDTVKTTEETKPTDTVDHPEDKLDLDQRSSPIARENFAKLKSISKENRRLAQEREQKIREYEAKFAELQKAPAPSATSGFDAAEIERIKAENKRLSDIVLIKDTENSPVFQNQYVKPKREALAAAEELLKAHGKEANLAALIAMPRGELGKAVNEILKELPPFDQTEISSQIQRAYQLRQQEQNALKEASATDGAIREQNARRDAQAFDNVWKQHSPKLQEMIQVFDLPAGVKLTAEQQAKVEEYNTAVKSLESQARKIATGAATHESIADASIKAAAYDLHVGHILPKMQAEIAAEFNQMQEVISQLTKEVEGYRSRNPNKQIRATTTSTNTPGKDPTIEEAAAAAWGK